ncbi:hypothetical protein QLX67_02015 [Balneolaceae bacterium ANBcel3]|nr:hypothetical protein [Balneolaceae bacterium ANBcel3]
MEKTENICTLIDDAAYLCDELAALKMVAESVPVMERPEGQDSLFDKIAKIFWMQEQLFLPFFYSYSEKVPPSDCMNYAAKGNKQTSYRDVMELYPDIHVLTTACIEKRKELLSILKTIDSSSWKQMCIYDGEENKAGEVLAEMVTLERKILKEAAERVMIFERSSS